MSSTEYDYIDMVLVFDSKSRIPVVGDMITLHQRRVPPGKKYRKPHTRNICIVSVNTVSHKGICAPDSQYYKSAIRGYAIGEWQRESKYFEITNTYYCNAWCDSDS